MNHVVGAANQRRCVGKRGTFGIFPSSQGIESPRLLSRGHEQPLFGGQVRPACHGDDAGAPPRRDGEEETRSQPGFGDAPCRILLPRWRGVGDVMRRAVGIGPAYLTYFIG